MYKDNLVAALQKAHQAGKCKGRIIVVKESDNIRGFDGCMKLSCELCSFSQVSKYLFATTKGTINEYKKLLYKKTKYVSKSFTIKILWQG